MKEISCYICSSKLHKILVKQIKKDKILTLINDKLNDLPRAISQCLDCGFVFHQPTLETIELDTLYKNYRNESFRKESPDMYFDRITSLSKDESENYKKTLYIDSLISKYSNFSNNKILNFYDVGTGGGFLFIVF